MHPSPPPDAHQVGERRVRIRFAHGIEGTVGPADMSESGLQKPHRTIKRGEERSCVVLACDPSQRKLLLSLKPSLVDSALPRVASFAAAKGGMTTHGVVWRVSTTGVIVALLGEVRGLVPASELRASLGAVWEADPHSCYREGQVAAPSS